MTVWRVIVGVFCALALSSTHARSQTTTVRRALLPDFSAPRAGVAGVREVSLADDPQNYAYMEREWGSYLFELRK